MRFRHALVAAAVVLPATSADARPGCNTRRCEERVAREQCARTRPVPCFRRAALLQRVPVRLLLRIGRCESGLQPFAVSSAGARGPMQFMPGTWQGLPWRYAHRSPFSMKWAPIAAGWLIRTDGVHHWNPSRSCWDGAR